jgi:hypothetical protein
LLRKKSEPPVRAARLINAGAAGKQQNDAMPTYSHPKNMSSSSQGPDRPAGKTFSVDFQRSSRQHLSKAELRELAAAAFANTARMKPVKKDGGR